MNAYGVGLATPQLHIEREARAPRAPATALRMRFDRFELDEENARLLCEGKVVDLPPRPFEVLCTLARRPGALLTKNALLDEVWGHRFVSESVLKTVIGKLRIALQDDARKARFIETVPRRGYRFIAAGSPTADLSAGSPRIAHLHHGPPARLDTGGITVESALRDIREMLVVLIETPHERHGAAARIVDYIAGRTLKAANEGG